MTCHSDIRIHSLPKFRAALCGASAPGIPTRRQAEGITAISPREMHMTWIAHHRMGWICAPAVRSTVLVLSAYRALSHARSWERIVNSMRVRRPETGEPLSPDPRVESLCRVRRTES